MTKVTDLFTLYHLLKFNQSAKLMRTKYNEALKRLKGNPNMVLCKGNKGKSLLFQIIQFINKK